MNKSATEDIRDILISRIKDINVFIGPERKFNSHTYTSPVVFIVEFSGNNIVRPGGCGIEQETNINIAIRSQADPAGTGSYRVVKELSNQISRLLAGCHGEYEERNIFKTRVREAAYLGRRPDNHHVYSIDVVTFKYVELAKVWISKDSDIEKPENLNVLSDFTLFKSFTVIEPTIFIKIPVGTVLTGVFDVSILIDSNSMYNTYQLTNVTNIEVN